MCGSSVSSRAKLLMTTSTCVAAEEQPNSFTAYTEYVPDVVTEMVESLITSPSPSQTSSSSGSPPGVPVKKTSSASQVSISFGSVSWSLKSQLSVIIGGSGIGRNEM